LCNVDCMVMQAGLHPCATWTAWSCSPGFTRVRRGLRRRAGRASLLHRRRDELQGAVILSGSEGPHANRDPVGSFGLRPQDDSGGTLDRTFDGGALGCNVDCIVMPGDLPSSEVSNALHIDPGAQDTGATCHPWQGPFASRPSRVGMARKASPSEGRGGLSSVQGRAASWCRIDHPLDHVFLQDSRVAMAG
jgi:hypothetical protein